MFYTTLMMTSQNIQTQCFVFISYFYCTEVQFGGTLTLLEYFQSMLLLPSSHSKIKYILLNVYLTGAVKQQQYDAVLQIKSSAHTQVFSDLYELTNKNDNVETRLSPAICFTLSV